jgi:hypothetical protein
VLLSALLVNACNKGKSLIDDARKQHDSGNLDGAVAALAQVKQQAPGTPEVAQASTLAVTWLLAAADAAPAKAPEREQRAKAALTWDPQSGAAQARVCRVAREAEAWDVLRACLDKNLAGKVDVPSDVVTLLRNALTAHDAEVQQEKANAETRARIILLASDDEADWAALQKQSPGSPEANMAAEKLSHAQSLCTDLDRFWSLYDQFKKDTSVVLKTFIQSRHVLLTSLGNVTRLPSGSVSPEWDHGLNKILDQTGKSAADLATRAHDVIDKVHAHRTANGEQATQQQLETFFKGLENTYHVLMEYGDHIARRLHGYGQQEVDDWRESWGVCEEAVYSPARTKILATCRK